MSAEGRNWAIAIGVNQYDRLPSLKYAERDAQEMAAFWQSIGFEFVQLFDSQQGDRLRQPTRANVIELLGQIAANRKLTAGDNFWFFFSGHGMLDAEGRDYLMPMEASPRSVAETGIRVSYVVEQLRQCGADNVVLLLDACRDEGRSTGARGVAGVGEDMANQGRLKGVVSIASCSPYESSYELEELQHGAFTHALLEAFRSQRGYATVASLDRYLVDRVPQLVGRDRRQTPHTVVEPIRKSHLILFPHQSEPGDWAVLEADALQAEFVEGNLQLADQLWRRINIASQGKLTSKFIDAITRIREKQKQQGVAPSPVVVPASPKRIEPTSKFVERIILEESRIRQEASRVGKLIRKTSSSYSSYPHTTSKPVKTQQATSQVIVENLGRGVTLELLPIAAGRFLMGSPRSEDNSNPTERPQHRVNVSTFHMGRYPITQAQWQAVAAWPKVFQDLNPSPAHFKGDHQPVEQVNWFECMEFCARLWQRTGRCYRLPSEAEWEYACRAGTKTRFYFGDNLSPELANYGGNHSGTTPVGYFPFNDFGLQDMHGNVWEWCLDNWHKNYQNAPVDGQPWLTGSEYEKMLINQCYTGDQIDNIPFQNLTNFDNEQLKLLRGGSWVDNPIYCRSAIRRWWRADHIYKSIGFRVTLSP